MAANCHQNSDARKHDPIAVVRGGLAGALAAALLAQARRKVVLFEEKLAWEIPCGGGPTHKALKQYPLLSETEIEHNVLRRCELISPSGRSVQLDAVRVSTRTLFPACVRRHLTACWCRATAGR